MSNPSHYATLTPSEATWVVERNGVEIARSSEVIILQETSGGQNYPAVAYFPADAVQGAELHATTLHTSCPLKGSANYFSVTVGGEEIPNSVWTYPNPPSDVAGIRDHLGFYPNHFEIREL